MGFYKIKKRNLNNALRIKRNKESLSELPKFFTNNNGSFYNKNNETLGEEESK